MYERRKDVKQCSCIYVLFDFLSLFLLNHLLYVLHFYEYKIFNISLKKS